jgi:hypothetical protein
MGAKRETYIKPVIITDRKLIEQLALDMVEMHNEKAFNLEYWPAAREFVTRFHRGEPKAQSRRGK